MSRKKRDKRKIAQAGPRCERRFVFTKEDWFPSWTPFEASHEYPAGYVLVTLTPWHDGSHWCVMVLGMDDSAMRVDVPSYEEGKQLFEQACKNPEKEWLRETLGFVED